MVPSKVAQKRAKRSRKKKPVFLYQYYLLKNGQEEGDEIVLRKIHCQQCGPGTFMAKHKNRFSCGKCGISEFFE